MTVRKCLMSAAMAVLACGSAAWATDQSAAVPGQSAIPQTASVYTLDAAASPTPLTPVMYWLGTGSVGKWLTDNNITIQGFVEGGYFYDTNNPRMGNQPDGDSSTLIGFPGIGTDGGGYSNRGLLDQADLFIHKDIKATSGWDWGFQAEGGYGTDDAVIHSNGNMDNRAGTNPDNQSDIIKANVSILIPIGSGLTIKAGKFVTLFGNETISPMANAFYSHSYNFSFGIPYTQTGVLGSYTFAKLLNGQDMTITAGITRGWNQSQRDNNGAIDFLGEASGNWNDKLSWIFNASEGPEATKDDSNYQTTLEFLPTYAFSDQLSATLDLLWSDVPHHSTTDAGHAAQWYSVAPYVSYKWNSNVTFNFRGEYYRDQGGFTVTTGTSANYYAATVGATIHPWPNDNVLQWLELRPELRYDYSDKPVFNHAHTGAITGTGDYNELTAAVDVIMQF